MVIIHGSVDDYRLSISPLNMLTLGARLNSCAGVGFPKRPKNVLCLVLFIFYVGFPKRRKNVLCLVLFIFYVVVTVARHNIILRLRPYE